MVRSFFAEDGERVHVAADIFLMHTDGLPRRGVSGLPSDGLSAVRRRIQRRNFRRECHSFGPLSYGFPIADEDDMSQTATKDEGFH